MSNQFESQVLGLEEQIHPANMKLSFEMLGRDLGNVDGGIHIVNNTIANILSYSSAHCSDLQKRKIEITTTELLLNSAWEGGDSEDLPVLFRIATSTRGLVLRVTDQLGGYDYHQALDRARENPNNLTDTQVLCERGVSEYPGGSGLYCLLHFTDAFVHNEEGNDVAALMKFSD